MEIKLNVPGISCNHCAHTIQMELMELAGVREVNVDVETKDVKIAYAAPADEAALRNLLAEINYQAAS
ncbi:MAG: heavy-metal-associated domain-containing protein [Anaerolineales bacterium]|nr:heavy-metal-associated domain-containing protein [Anaerolineales bacterium]